MFKFMTTLGVLHDSKKGILSPFEFVLCHLFLYRVTFAYKD